MCFGFPVWVVFSMGFKLLLRFGVILRFRVPGVATGVGCVRVQKALML